MIVRRRTSPSADGAASGVVIGMLWATRFIVYAVCMQVVAMSTCKT